MTDTTDIKALRAESANLMILLHKEELGVEVTLTAAKFYDDVFRLIEAERQRADDAHKYGSERDAENESLMLTVGRLRVEIAELKGEQVPIAWLNDAHLARGHIEGEAGEEDAGPGMIPVYREKFTAPQKPVVLPGISELIDACDSTPAVRDVHVWDLAISEVKRLNPGLFFDKSAAGGIVKDGE